MDNGHTAANDYADKGAPGRDRLTLERVTEEVADGFWLFNEEAVVLVDQVTQTRVAIKYALEHLDAGDVAAAKRTLEAAVA